MSLPEKFCWKTYLDLNNDLLNAGIHNKNITKTHYLNWGIKEGRKYKYDLPDDFNWETYLKLNQDLLEAGIHKKQLAKKHYFYYGKNEGRLYNTESYLHKYENVFHKYILNIASNKAIQYDIIRSQNITTHVLIHLHIYNIESFYDFFNEETIQNLMDFGSVIITFITGHLHDTHFNSLFTILKIQNKGMDIGGKLCMLDYITQHNIPYNYILFLHSKSDYESRQKYFLPFLKNKERINLIKSLLTTNNNSLYGIFPNCVHYTDNYKSSDRFLNDIKYFEEMMHLLNIDVTDSQFFVEGNCCILHRNVLETIFKDRISLFYNVLNDENSFDYNWVKMYYYTHKGLNDNINLIDVYKKYTEENLLGSCLNVNCTTDINNFYRDGMIEHVFERLWINIIKKLNGDFLIVDSDDWNQKILLPIERLPIDFNWKMYLELNHDLLKAGFNNKKSVIEHYLNWGKNEGRKYKYNLQNENEDNNSIIHESNILRTFYFKDNILKTNFLKYKLKITDINLFKKFILVVDFNNGGGGTTFFLNSIVSKYKSHQTFLIIRKTPEGIILNINEEYEIENTLFSYENCIDFLKTNCDKIIKIFVNHNKDYDCAFIDFLFELYKEVIGITHDYSNLFKNPQPFFEKLHKGGRKNMYNVDINKYTTILTQNDINKIIFNKYYHKSITNINMPDYYKSKKLIKTKNANTVIGIIGYITDIKGLNILNTIQQLYSNYKFIIFGAGGVGISNNIISYLYNNVEELNILLETYKPNMLLELSIWPETYSYTLTMSMLTKLPIIYLKKQFDSVIENRLSNYKAYSFQHLKELEMLFINCKQNYLYTISPYIYYDKLWDYLFITNDAKRSNNLTRTKNNIKPYFVYFPQFHVFKENNTSFYEGYTDVTNLKLLKDSKLENVETPSFSEYNLNSVLDYNLLNHSIIQKQIDIISDYNMNGFAMYYYWFSLNTITNKNMIMENVINQFFNHSIDMKNRNVFFIWANEDWSNNPAFGSNNEKIENTYDEINIINNSKSLIRYFKSSVYLKIENKPVFFIYHPWFLSSKELDLFYSILNNECILNGFSGVHFVVNSMNGKYDKYINFNIHFNYKKGTSRYYNEEKKQTFIHYKDYNTNLENSKNVIQTIAYDFNNKARLIKPNRLHLSTVCDNNTEADKIMFTNKLVEMYNNDKYSDVENILLINAWNEWGEKMHFEPSNEYNYYNLNLLKDQLC